MAVRTKKTLKISKKSARIIDEFDAAAQSHGWESDQGTSKAALKALDVYSDKLYALQNHISKLEQRIALLTLVSHA
mgnify:CR=1 FL=1